MKKFLLKALSVIFLLYASAASAVIIATYNPGSFAQSGSVTNNYSQTLVGVTIDFGVDAGVSGGGSPIWDTNNGSFVGTPTGTFSNLVPGTTDDYFTVSWSGLNISTGNSFLYSGLDLDGFISSGNISSGFNAVFDGTETVRLLFADNSYVSGNFTPTSTPSSLASINFDSDNLINASVPEPSAIALMGLGLLGFAATRRMIKK